SRVFPWSVFYGNAHGKTAPDWLHAGRARGMPRALRRRRLRSVALPRTPVSEDGEPHPLERGPGRWLAADPHDRRPLPITWRDSQPLPHLHPVLAQLAVPRPQLPP